MFEVVSFCSSWQGEKLYASLPRATDTFYIVSRQGKFLEIGFSSNLYQLVSDRHKKNYREFDKRYSLHYLELPENQRLLQRLKAKCNPHEFDLTIHQAIQKAGDVIIDFYEMEAKCREELAESAADLSKRIYWYRLAIQSYLLLASFKNHKLHIVPNHNEPYFRRARHLTDCVRTLARQDFNRKYSAIV